MKDIQKTIPLSLSEREKMMNIWDSNIILSNMGIKVDLSDEMVISVSTVHNHLSSVYKRLGIARENIGVVAYLYHVMREKIEELRSQQIYMPITFNYNATLSNREKEILYLHARLDLDQEGLEQELQNLGISQDTINRYKYWTILMLGVPKYPYAVYMGLNHNLIERPQENTQEVLTRLVRNLTRLTPKERKLLNAFSEYASGGAYRADQNINETLARILNKLPNNFSGQIPHIKLKLGLSSLEQFAAASYYLRNYYSPISTIH